MFLHSAEQPWRQQSMKADRKVSDVKHSFDLVHMDQKQRKEYILIL